MLSRFTRGHLLFTFSYHGSQVQRNQLSESFARICEPYLEPFRRFIPPLGMIDISPLVAIFALRLATNGLISLFGYFL